MSKMLITLAFVSPRFSRVITKMQGGQNAFTRRDLPNGSDRYAHRSSGI
jgi:hypothetical protein